MDYNQFITNNYTFLLSVAKNIVSTNRTSEEEPYELISFMVEQLYEGKVKCEDGTEEGLRKVCVMFLRNQFKWPLSTYNKIYKNANFKHSPYGEWNKGILKNPSSEEITEMYLSNYSSVLELDCSKGDYESQDSKMEHFYNILDEESIKLMELTAENCSEKAKEYIKELENYGYSNDQIKKILNTEYIHSIYLSKPEQILFNMYFKEDYTYKTIAAKLNVPQSAVFLMVKDLKEKILTLHNNGK